MLLAQEMRRCGNHPPSYSAVNPVNCNNDLHGKMYPWMKQWHKCYGGGYQLLSVPSSCAWICTFINRLMQLPDLVRRVCLCNGCWLTQKIITSQSTKNKTQRISQPQMGHLYYNCSHDSETIMENWSESLQESGLREDSNNVFWIWKELIISNSCGCLYIIRLAKILTWRMNWFASPNPEGSTGIWFLGVRFLWGCGSC